MSSGLTGSRRRTTAVEEVLSRTEGNGVERVSVAAPAKTAQQAALEMAAKRAKVVYFAGYPSTTPSARST